MKPFEYKCGHTTTGAIIINNNMAAMSAYIEWALEDKNLETQNQCFDCFLKNDNKILS